MGFLSPITAIIAAAIAVPALVALYFLKLRRKQLAVPSTLLWRKAIQDMQVNAPFQRLRRNLLLLLQLILLAALLIAMARPTMHSVAAPGQRVVIVIDHSASMNATESPSGSGGGSGGGDGGASGGASGGATRLDDAKRAALGLVDDLGAGTLAGGASEAMIVTFAERAAVAQRFTTDLSQLRAAVDNVSPTDQRSRLAAALQLVEPYALQAAASDGEDVLVYILTDGQVHEEPGEALSLPGARIIYQPVGDEAADNVGIVAFSARRDFERPERVQLFARLANYGPAEVSTNLELRLDGRVSRVERMTLPGVSEDGVRSRSVQFDFTLAEAALVELAHDHADMLAADDTVRLTLAPSRRLRVLLVTEGNPFLERVVGSVGVRRLVRMHPERYETQDLDRLRRGGWDASGTSASAEEGFDVILFDAYTPERTPTVDSLYFAAAPPIEGLSLHGPREGDRRTQAILDWQRDHPMMRYIVLDDIAMNQPARLAVPGDAYVLATGESGPVIAELRHEGVRHVVTSFDVLQSNWPLYVSFPVFISNVVQTLGLGALAEEAGLAYQTGEGAAVPYAGDADRLRYAGPTELAARVSRREAHLPPFARVGVYRTSDESVEPPFDRLAVNLLDPLESDVRVRGELNVGTSSVAAAADHALTRREVWRWFVWAGLAMLMIEWLVYTRRMHI
ncbi:MAG: VWA domain-containing protein [Phycisphaeraceae bacterium]